jgi:hypothetical protein
VSELDAAIDAGKGSIDVGQPGPPGHVKEGCVPDTPKTDGLAVRRYAGSRATQGSIFEVPVSGCTGYIRGG